MAMAKLGGGITEINGRMGGNIYRRDQCGQHIQGYPRIIDRHPSPSQLKRRNAWRTCYGYWKKHATWEFVARWQQYANNHTITNRKGETYALTHYQMFMKINVTRVYNDVEITEYPPT